jgi:CheY-like chemotaxis protein
MSPFGHDFDAGRPIDGLHVLVVDDEPDGRQAMAYALEDQGARVTVVASAREALLAIESEVPDVLVSDLAMPEEDGYALIRRVRALASDRGGRLPAVAVTAECGAEDKVHALRAGFQLHLAKPVSPADVAAALALLARRKGNDPALRRTA